MTENEALRAQLEQARFDKAEYIAASDAACKLLSERFDKEQEELHKNYNDLWDAVATYRAALGVNSNEAAITRIKAIQQQLAEVTRERDASRENFVTILADWNAMNKAYDEARAQRDALAVALDDLLGCPFTIDAASIPACGIEAAPPYQVVSVMSVAWTRIQNAHQALAAVEAKEGE
jgi:chromosome segregation ATPase